MSESLGTYIYVWTECSTHLSVLLSIFGFIIVTTWHADSADEI